MPSGLLQTVLCDEKLQQSYERTDELFYYTMQEIVNRLKTSTSVIAPVDDGRDLTPRNIDHQRMTNWKNRLKANWRIWKSYLVRTAQRMMQFRHGMASLTMITGANR